MHGAHNTCMPVHTLRKKCTCTRVCAPMQRCRSFFAMEAIANLFWVLREHRADCRSPPALQLSRQNQSPDTVRSRNPSKSTLAHDAVAAAVSHTHHSIIHVGAGLIQFVYGSHSKRAHGGHFIKNSIFAIFFVGFWSSSVHCSRWASRNTWHLSLIDCCSAIRQSFKSLTVGDDGMSLIGATPSMWAKLEIYCMECVTMNTSVTRSLAIIASRSRSLIWRSYARCILKLWAGFRFDCPVWWLFWEGGLWSPWEGGLWSPSPTLSIRPYDQHMTESYCLLV